jgi:DNA-binding CsgD family transcriptional regulator
MNSEAKKKWRDGQLREASGLPVPAQCTSPTNSTSATDLAGLENWTSLKILRGDTERTRLLVELIPQPEHQCAGLPETGLRLLLDNYAPPSVVVDGLFRCRCYFGPVGQYLEKDGAIEGDLFAIARQKLIPKLQAAFMPLCHNHTDVASLPAFEREEDPFASLSIAVLPFHHAGERLFLVSFLDFPVRLAPTGGLRDRGNGTARQDQPAAASAMACLSSRQRAVLELVASGESNKRIAAVLGISQRTVESHRAIVMRKLGARSLAGLMRLVAAA